MTKLYKARIREDIPNMYNGIGRIREYAGKIVYVTSNERGQRNYIESSSYEYKGRYPNNNIGFMYGWIDGCFSEIEEIT